MPATVVGGGPQTIARFGANTSGDDCTPHTARKYTKYLGSPCLSRGKRFHILRVSHLFLWPDLHFCHPCHKYYTGPLIKASNGLNDAILLKQTFNRILFYFCYRQYFGVSVRFRVSGCPRLWLKGGIKVDCGLVPSNGLTMSGVFFFIFSTGSCRYIYTVIAPTFNNIGLVVLAPDKTSYCGWNTPFYLLLE